MQVTSSFFYCSGCSNGDLLKLRFLRCEMNVQFSNAKQRLSILKRRDSFPKRSVIRLRQINQPVIFCPAGKVGLFKACRALEARHYFVDPLISKKAFYAWRKPGNGRAFGVKRFEGGKVAGQVFRLTLKNGGLGRFTF